MPDVKAGESSVAWPKANDAAETALADEVKLAPSGPPAAAEVAETEDGRAAGSVVVAAVEGTASGAVVGAGPGQLGMLTAYSAWPPPKSGLTAAETVVAEPAVAGWSGVISTRARELKPKLWIWIISLPFWIGICRLNSDMKPDINFRSQEEMHDFVSSVADPDYFYTDPDPCSAFHRYRTGSAPDRQTNDTK